MSTESMNHGQDGIPDHFQTPKSSSGKKWLIGGCGCLLVLLLICGGGGAYTWFKVFKPLMDIVTETMVLLEESDAIREHLGDNITSGGQGETTQNGEKTTMRIPVSGSKGTGTVVIEFNNSTFERTDMYFEMDGERIELNELEPIEIDDGS